MSEQIPIKDGFYWLCSERSSGPSIMQVCLGKIYVINEVGPISLEELERRGWEKWKPARPGPMP